MFLVSRNDAYYQSDQNAPKSNHGGTFSSYRKFIGRHRKSKSQRRSKRKLKKLFMDWLKEERGKVIKEEREKVIKEGSEMH